MQPDREGRLIVCAVDGSTADAGAVELAAQLAVLAGARLALVGFVPLPIDELDPEGLPAWTLSEARRALELTADTVRTRVAVDCYLELGNPIRGLLELALRTRALLLVVGARAPAIDRPASIVVGGVARRAPCPVVVVPEAAPVPVLDLDQLSPG